MNAQERVGYLADLFCQFQQRYLDGHLLFCWAHEKGSVKMIELSEMIMK